MHHGHWLTGRQNLKQTGRKQNLRGQEQEARGQVNEYASGAADRVTGADGQRCRRVDRGQEQAGRVVMRSMIQGRRGSAGPSMML